MIITSAVSFSVPSKERIASAEVGLGKRRTSDIAPNSSRLTAMITSNVSVSVQLPLIAVRVTVYVPFAAKACVGAVAEEFVKSPKSHEYELAPEEVLLKVTTFPFVVNEPAAVGVVLKSMVIGAEVPTPSQASAFVVVTETVASAETVIDWVVSPVDHE